MPVDDLSLDHLDVVDRAEVTEQRVELLLFPLFRCDSWPRIGIAALSFFRRFLRFFQLPCDFIPLLLLALPLLVVLFREFSV